ncbi:MAG: dihydrofolate reductase, partial [Paraprevotella sp.]|nr:dihydrofolate reductase [Paraprevotella sp.]
DPTLHEEVLQRYKSLHLSPYKGFINPIYTPIYNKECQIIDVQVSYGEAYDEQMLRYSRDYATLPYINE